VGGSGLCVSSPFAAAALQCLGDGEGGDQGCRKLVFMTGSRSRRRCTAGVRADVVSSTRAAWDYWARNAQNGLDPSRRSACCETSASNILAELFSWPTSEQPAFSTSRQTVGCLSSSRLSRRQEADRSRTASWKRYQRSRKTRVRKARRMGGIDWQPAVRRPLAQLPGSFNAAISRRCICTLPYRISQAHQPNSRYWQRL
jgi:hypothetical protein